MGTLEPIDIGASEHWEKMGIWGKCTPRKMSTRANQQLGQIGILGPMDMNIVGVGGLGSKGVGVGEVGIGGLRLGFRVGVLGSGVLGPGG